MGKRQKITFHPLIFGALLAVFVMPNSSVYAVVGAIEIVAGQEGQPVPETTISIFQGGALVKEEQTDNNGMAVISLEEGDYRIVLKSSDQAIESNISVEPEKLLSLTGDFDKGAVTANEMPVGRYRSIKATSTQKGYSVSSADLGGLMSYQISTPQGAIYLGFPYHATQGETVSCSAILLPSGSDAKEVEKNLGKLQDYQLRLGNNIYSFKKSAGLRMEAAPIFNTALLSENGRKTLIQVTVKIRLQSSFIPVKPLVSTAGWPICIPGVFDGDASNTQVRFGGEPIEVNAETSTSVIINPHNRFVGLQNVTITDAGNTTETEVRNVNLELYADKTDLMRGEGTRVHLKIHGIETFENPAFIQLYNLSTSIVSLGGGNAQFFLIAPGSAEPGGIIAYDRNLTGIRRGKFMIFAVLHTW